MKMRKYCFQFYFLILTAICCASDLTVRDYENLFGSASKTVWEVHDSKVLNVVVSVRCDGVYMGGGTYRLTSNKRSGILLMGAVMGPTCFIPISIGSEESMAVNSNLQIKALTIPKIIFTKPKFTISNQQELEVGSFRCLVFDQQKGKKISDFKIYLTGMDDSTYKSNIEHGSNSGSDSN